ncbi:YCII-related domain protein [Polychaeton citri CBS 116435]|uniref:YCII-related domain protein n=1 Tax=Polychaeton citri CBS 116435 TaxID=1314669 RepID=A0A9P4URZ4_9PEZI|nr:YCII-related domain protein [Polychaeton citri CBS 116435]
MSSKQEWIVILPDYKGALEQRMKVRPDHLKNMGPVVEAGKVVFGGATLDEPIKEGEPPKINGSIMLACADTKEEALELIKEDIYTKSGVWDLDNLQIFPFKSAIRKEL